MLHPSSSSKISIDITTIIIFEIFNQKKILTMVQKFYAEKIQSLVIMSTWVLKNTPLAVENKDFIFILFFSYYEIKLY